MTIEQYLSISKALGIAAFHTNATQHPYDEAFQHLVHSNDISARDRTKMIDAWREGYDLALTNWEQR